MNKKTLNRIFESVLGSIFVLMLLLTIWQIVSRFILGDPSTFTEESLRFLIIWLVILGSGYATLNDLHFGMTLFSGSLTGNKKKYAGLFNQLVSLVFNITVFIIGGYVLVSNNMEQVSPVLGVSIGLIYLIFIISGIACSLICLFKIKQLFTVDEEA